MYTHRIHGAGIFTNIYPLKITQMIPSVGIYPDIILTPRSPEVYAS